MSINAVPYHSFVKTQYYQPLFRFQSHIPFLYRATVCKAFKKEDAQFGFTTSVYLDSKSAPVFLKTIARSNMAYVGNAAQGGSC